MDRQRTVCAVEGVPFESKIDLISTHVCKLYRCQIVIVRRHRRQVLHWLHEQFQSGSRPDSFYTLFTIRSLWPETAPSKSANIETDIFSTNTLSQSNCDSFGLIQPVACRASNKTI